MERSKVYIDVTAKFSKEGVFTPKSFRWTDGSVYEMQSVKDIRRAASLKAGSAGTGYACMTDRRESCHYYEDSNMCFLEGRAGA